MFRRLARSNRQKAISPDRDGTLVEINNRPFEQTGRRTARDIVCLHPSKKQKFTLKQAMFRP